MKSIQVIEQDSGLWFVYEAKRDGQSTHIGSIFDKGNKVAGLPNSGYQVVNWDGSPDPMIYAECCHFWSAVAKCRELARLSCNY
jgi:hypothetical protein